MRSQTLINKIKIKHRRRKIINLYQSYLAHQSEPDYAMETRAAPSRGLPVFMKSFNNSISFEHKYGFFLNSPKNQEHGGLTVGKASNRMKELKRQQIKQFTAYSSLLTTLSLISTAGLDGVKWNSGVE